MYYWTYNSNVRYNHYKYIYAWKTFPQFTPIRLKLAISVVSPVISVVSPIISVVSPKFPLFPRYFRCFLRYFRCFPQFPLFPPLFQLFPPLFPLFPPISVVSPNFRCFPRCYSFYSWIINERIAIIKETKWYIIVYLPNSVSWTGNNFTLNGNYNWNPILHKHLLNATLIDNKVKMN